MRRTLLVLGAVSVAGCGSNESATRARSPTPPQPVFQDLTPLTSGRTYTTHLFQPTLRFTVQPGAWQAEDGDTRNEFSVSDPHPKLPVLQAILAAHRIVAVYDPRRGGDAPGDQVPFRGSFAAWLERHPRLRVTSPVPVALLGLKGVRLDVRARSTPPKVPRNCAKIGARLCAPIFSDAPDPVLATEDSISRFIVLALPHGGELVLEEYVEPLRAFRRGLARLRPLLASLTRR